MKKKKLALVAIGVLIIATLSGCTCGKESKFVGTWVKKKTQSIKTTAN